MKGLNEKKLSVFSVIQITGRIRTGNREKTGFKNIGP